MAGTNPTETGVHHWQVHPDPTAAAAACAEHLAQRILAVLETREHCHVALPGGSTPATCLSHLAEQPLPWNRVHWYLGDERCLPRGAAARNDHMIKQHLWHAITAPKNTIHPIPAEQGAERAAEIYAELIDTIDKLDIVLLGMGEDGHTASLFPDNPALKNPASVVPIHHAPKPPAERVSLGITTLKATMERIVLATGPGKRDAIDQVKAGAPLPINRIGPLLWFVDQAAVD